MQMYLGTLGQGVVIFVTVSSAIEHCFELWLGLGYLQMGLGRMGGGRGESKQEGWMCPAFLFK